jgi:hypothetical protein
MGLEDAIDTDDSNPNSGGKSKYSEDDILGYILDFYEENGYAHSGEFNSDSQYPSVQTVYNLFGSWNNALKEAGLEVNRERLDRRDIIEELKRFKDEYGRIDSESFDKDTSYPSVGVVQREFGSWNDGLEEAGISLSHEYGFEADLSIREIEIIVGNVLGDASLYKRTESSGRYRHDDIHREYLEHIISECPSIFEGCDVKEKENQDIYYINSRTCEEILDIYDWLHNYEGDKIFPHLIDLSPRVMKYWYITDGTLHEESYPMIQCNWLGEEGVKIAANRISNKITNCISIRGPYHREDRDKPDISIAIKQEGVDDFFEYIGDCPVECYEYKWA